MVIFFIVFFIYALIRIILLLQYLLLNKHIWDEINIKRNNQKNGTYPNCLDPELDIEKKDQNLWISLYKRNVLTKRIFTSALLSISLFIGFNNYLKTGAWTNITPILAGTVVLQFFNSMFEWVEIDNPIGMSPIVPPRIFAKKRPKKFLK
ncbi:hypothetical protein [uncultured Fructobacillus sp.]|uniref:hypothetical protein n=1 Tax=uncultured Fructobacillus sp. TaxID=591942 RepID=UPI0025988854|nr:hypothetical protein [uncultured Fructobacillus sp.]